MNFVWLASFGRSGNTWLRFLIYQYLYGKCDDTDKLEETLPFVNLLTDADVNSYRHTIISKTHHYWDAAKHPFADRTLGVVYIVRNPRDVLLSWVNYLHLKNELVEGERQFALNFIEYGGVPKSEYHQESWSDHFYSWRECPYPNICIKYEELLEDTEKTFARVVRFMNLDFSNEKLKDAVRWSSFEEMKALEIAAKHAGKEYVFMGGLEEMNKGYSFVNKGLSGQSLDALGKDLEPAFIERFGEAMKVFGYT